MSAVSPGVHQGLLVKYLRDIFPHEETLVDTKKESNLKYPGTQAYLEIDAWLPNLGLCFEFQDSYHYTITWYSHITLEKVQQKDDSKKSTVRKNEATLVDVPCWWDGSLESLLGTIRFQRPDLFSPGDFRPSLGPTNYSDPKNYLGPIDFDPIPLNPPTSYFQPISVPGVGELMLASFPMDAAFYSVSHTNWWVGEKYDGIRCCWNPQQRILYTRTAKKIALPFKVALILPLIFLDSEIWFGRRQFSLTHSLFSSEEVIWTELRLLGFDVASSDLHEWPFEKRYEKLLSSVCPGNPFVMVAARLLSEESHLLKDLAQGVIEEGGEGVIMRRVGSPYINGRTPYLVKLKTTLGDREGIVKDIDHHRYVHLQLPEGKTLAVPFHSVQTTMPKIGDVVTFAYVSNTRRDVVVQPTIVRIRTDLSWEDVVGNFAREKKYLNEHSQVFGNDVPEIDKAMYHYGSLPPITSLDSASRYSWSEIEARRNFFEKYAEEEGFDPLLAGYWYSQPISKIMATKGAPSVVSYHGDSLVTALTDLFPDIGLDPAKFNVSAFKSRRKILEKYARERGFDPLSPAAWYSQNITKMKSNKEIKMVVKYHRGSIVRALLDLFPNIGLDKSKFWNKFYWSSVENRRNFFEKFARVNNFDPLIPTNWYSQNRRKIASFKGGTSVLEHHEGKVAKALLDLFPHIGLEKSKLWQRDLPDWGAAKNRRKLFEKFAETNHFDPLVPARWYAASWERIMAFKGVSSVICYHKNSYVHALLDLFPDIGLEKSKFGFWFAQPSHRRQFFEEYAKQVGFDPLVAKNWYIHKNELSNVQGVNNVISYHKGSVLKALLDLFPEIGIEKSKIYNIWSDTEYRRLFFEKYAKENGFDYLVAENWYSQPKAKILSVKGAASAILYHNNNLTQTLSDLFPHIGFSKSKANAAWKV